MHSKCQKLISQEELKNGGTKKINKGDKHPLFKFKGPKTSKSIVNISICSTKNDHMLFYYIIFSLLKRYTNTKYYIMFNFMEEINFLLTLMPG